MIDDDLKFKLIEIPISSRGAYSISRIFSNTLKANKQGTIYKTISEGVSLDFSSNKKGGIITFSTEVNAVNLDENKLIDWVKKKAATIENKINKDRKINEIGQKHNLNAWTVGNFLSCRYTADNGKVFDESSLSVEIIGIDSNELVNIAEELCIMFLQESVLVKDYSTNKIFLVDAE